MNTILELIKNLFSSISEYFSTRKAITDTQAANIEEVQQDKKDIKQESQQQRKLDKRFENKKRSYLVSKLKKGMNIRVNINGKWEKFTYAGHTDKEVLTTSGESFPYGQVTNYHMKELYYNETNN